VFVNLHSCNYTCTCTYAGGKYILAACDSNVIIFDFETRRPVRTFNDVYGCFCDFVLPINNPDMPVDKQALTECLILTRGVEEANEEGFPVTGYNKVMLHKLTFPEGSSHHEWKFDVVQEYTHDDYFANVYMCKLATNGYYVAAPTVQNSVFVWNILTGALVAIIKGGSTEKEIRDIKFHPSKKLMFVSGDDGCVKIYGPEE